ncbi:MAG: hypothetical protein ACFFHV_22630 [Promethearchaeota archaeon]
MGIHEQIRDILLDHKGKRNSITAEKIAEQIGIQSGPSGVNIREKITETIINYKLPVASINTGYYLLEDEADLKRYERSLEGRANKIIFRKFKIIEYFYEYYKKEILEFTKEIFEEPTDDEEYED